MKVETIRRVDPRRYEAQEPIEETHGPCIKFHKCKSVGVLGNGLCVDCWDVTRK